MRDRKKDAERIILIATWVSIIYMIVATILVFTDANMGILTAIQCIWIIMLTVLGTLLTITNIKRSKEFSFDVDLGTHTVKFESTGRYINVVHCVKSDDGETIYRYTVDLKKYIIHCYTIDYNRPDGTYVYAFYNNTYGSAHEESKSFTTFDSYFDGLAWTVAKSSMPLGKDVKENYIVCCPHNVCDGKIVTL